MRPIDADSCHVYSLANGASIQRCPMYRVGTTKTFLGKEHVDTNVMHNAEHFFKELTAYKASRYAEDVSSTTMLYPTV